MNRRSFFSALASCLASVPVIGTYFKKNDKPSIAKQHDDVVYKEFDPQTMVVPSSHRWHSWTMTNGNQIVFCDYLSDTWAGCDNTLIYIDEDGKWYQPGNVRKEGNDGT